MHQILNGGKVVDAGGYGCVFIPSLSCNEQPKTNETRKYVTKLMLKNDAEEEYNMLNSIRVDLCSIPNYKSYFLIDNISLCNPDKLNKEDLVFFNKKCKPLVKNNITSHNINSQLDLLYALNMPYGGISMDTFMYNENSFNELFHLNRKLCDLLEHAIIPMNNKHVCHGDLKASNILLLGSGLNMYTRIIDWGLSVSKTNKTSFHNYMSSFNFNIIFSVVMMRDSFIKTYNASLFFGLSNNNQLSIYEHILSRINKEGLKGLELLNVIFKILFKDTQIYQNVLLEIPASMRKHKYKYIVPFLLKYNYQCVNAFTIDGKFLAQKYFSDVMVYNIDIWGFISCYAYMVLPYANKKVLRSYDISIIAAVRELYVIIMQHASTKINNVNIVSQLHKLGRVFNNGKYNVSTNANKDELYTPPISVTMIKTLDNLDTDISSKIHSPHTKRENKYNKNQIKKGRLNITRKNKQQ